MKKASLKIHPSWRDHFDQELQKVYMSQLNSFILEQRQHHVIYPSDADIFNAFSATPFQDIKVVILGQDPYHGAGQAHGLSFSVQHPVPPPPSLVNIYKEIERDLGIPKPNHGHLSHWASQGVFLLNTILTVREKEPLSHAHQGWETFTDSIIQKLDEQGDHLVFVLWGSSAQKKKNMIHNDRHLVLSAPHPSPLSAYRGFNGCGHFSAINRHLASVGKSAIDWSLPSISE